MHFGRPPSLDTINRTYRNIDLALESQTQQIEALTARVAKLDIDMFSSPRRRSVRENGSVSSVTSNGEGDNKKTGFRPQVTPSIAASTAAALNAERSAQRLKTALFNARKIPLLNTQAVEPVKRVPTLDSLSKPASSNFLDSESGRERATSLESSEDYSRDRDTEGGGDIQRRPSRQFAHQKSVKLGKTTAQVPSSIVSFDWGPLPKAQPMSTLPSDIRPKLTGKNPSS